MDRGLFDFDRISLDIDRPAFISSGGGYPNERAHTGTVIDVLGAGQMTQRSLRTLIETSRPGYPMIGGHRRSRHRKRRRTRNSRRTRNYKK